MITGDAAKERQGETHREKDGYDYAKVHEPLERLASFAEKSVHPVGSARTEADEQRGREVFGAMRRSSL